MAKINLRKLDWPDIIVYFTNMDKDCSTSKDLVDYFHFLYLSKIDTGKWSTPDYIRQTGSAKKLISLYGSASFTLVDTLFDRYKQILGREFQDIRWSLGLLSSEKTGWIMERVFLEINNKESIEKKDVIKRILAKNRQEWSIEEIDTFNDYIKENNDGKKKEKVSA